MPQPRVFRKDGATRPSSSALPVPLEKGISLKGHLALSLTHPSKESSLEVPTALSPSLPQKAASSEPNDPLVRPIFARMKPKDSSVKGKALLSSHIPTSASSAKSKKRENLFVSPPSPKKRDGSRSAKDPAKEPAILTIPLSPKIKETSGSANGPANDKSSSAKELAKGPVIEPTILSNFPAIPLSQVMKEKSGSTIGPTKDNSRAPMGPPGKDKSRSAKEVAILSRSEMMSLFSGLKRVPADKDESQAPKKLGKTRVGAHCKFINVG